MESEVSALGICVVCISFQRTKAEAVSVTAAGIVALWINSVMAAQQATKPQNTDLVPKIHL